ncbi:MAG: hypothetical protein ACTSSH_02735 [Candidatus Heimdallarchaeota archaeon]
MPSKKQSFILGLFLLTTMFISFNLATMSDSYLKSVYDDELGTFKVEDLEAGVTYIFRVEPYSSYFTYDIGFSVHEDHKYDNDTALLYQDTPGTGPEEAQYTATTNGTYYIGVWVTDDGGLLEITVEEQGTGFDKPVTNYSPSIFYSLRWLWIMLGVIGVFTVISISVIVFVGVRAVRKHQARVALARKSGAALPRAGRRKNKCPFCNVKIPSESLVTCPYCNAPITDDS